MKSNNQILKNAFKYNNHIYKLNKVSNKYKREDNNLIVLTSINPTKYGEGKTTTLIGLVDLFNYFNESATGCLRQPSIGPYFGMKGGATGSGRCSIKNDEVINLGLTGDFEKIALVNNLIMSIIENELFNKTMDINPESINWRRCVDLNDRSLRKIKYEIKDIAVESSYTITAASNIMALFCLSKDTNDFLKKLDSTEICKLRNGDSVFVKDLNITNSIKKVIDKALNPNIVFTKNNNLIFMHGGPFANIAHGTNSLISTYESMKYSKYTFVESGFGSDLGLEKFINIVSREGDLKPKLSIYAISFASLKEHGDSDFDKMVSFLKRHLDISSSFNLNSIVLLNKFRSDDSREISNFINHARANGINITISDLYNKPLSKNKNLLNFIKKNLYNNNLSYSYKLTEDVFKKIESLAKKVYKADKIEYSKQAIKKLEENKNLKYYLCMAKSYKNILPSDNILRIDDVYINHASKFIIPICDDIFLMPGLPKVPNAKLLK